MHKLLESNTYRTAARAAFGFGFVLAVFLLGASNSQATTLYPDKPSLEELSIELSEQAQEAVNNGVLLTIDCEFANIKTWLFINVAKNIKNHKFTLSRHTLSNRYIVKRDNLSTPHLFRSIPEATNFIRAQALVLLESYTTYDTQRKMRISLNKFELPGPMRLQALLLNKWDLDTGWLAWEFEN